MRQLLDSVSDRMLALFLPKKEAGACVCFPEDSYYQYRCYLGQYNQRRLCRYNCNCVLSCGSWVDIGDC